MTITDALTLEPGARIHIVPVAGKKRHSEASVKRRSHLRSLGALGGADF